MKSQVTSVLTVALLIGAVSPLPAQIKTKPTNNASNYRLLEQRARPDSIWRRDSLMRDTTWKDSLWRDSLHTGRRDSTFRDSTWRDSTNHDPMLKRKPRPAPKPPKRDSMRISSLKSVLLGFAP